MLPSKSLKTLKEGVALVKEDFSSLHLGSGAWVTGRITKCENWGSKSILRGNNFYPQTVKTIGFVTMRFLSYFKKANLCNNHYFFTALVQKFRKSQNQAYNRCCFDISQSTAAFTFLVLSKNCCKKQNAKVDYGTPVFSREAILPISW